MPEDKNLHENHRGRMRERFKTSPDSLSKHELLEIALFTAIPRVNVNPVAHRLIDKFGSLSGVIHATVPELTQVEGVGESAATFLAVLGRISDAALDETLNEQRVLTPSDLKTYLTRYFRNQASETFLAFMLDSQSRVINKELISQNEKNKVEVSFTQFSNLLATKSVRSVIVVHNHPSGNCEPSEEDDLATEKFLFYCDLMGVKLYDHMIVSGNNLFSYRLAGRLDFMKEGLNSLPHFGEKRR